MKRIPILSAIAAGLAVLVLASCAPVLPIGDKQATGDQGSVSVRVQAVSPLIADLYARRQGKTQAASFQQAASRAYLGAGMIYFEVTNLSGAWIDGWYLYPTQTNAITPWDLGDSRTLPAGDYYLNAWVYNNASDGSPAVYGSKQFTVVAGQPASQNIVWITCVPWNYSNAAQGSTWFGAPLSNAWSQSTGLVVGSESWFRLTPSTSSTDITVAPSAGMIPMFFLFDQNGVFQQVAGYGSTPGTPVALTGVSTVAGTSYYLGVINMGGSAVQSFDLTYSVSSTAAETPITTFGEYIPGALAPNQIVTYTFNSMPGHVYAVSWDDSFRGSGAYYADLMVAAVGQSSGSLMLNTDSGYRGFYAASGSIIDYHQLIYTYAAASEKVSIMVSEYSPGYSSGTFGLKVTDVSSGVLVIGDGATENTMVPALQGAGYQNVTTVSRSAFDGSQLSGKAEVILIGGNDYSTDMSATGQLALLSFVNTGGNLLFTEWIAYQMGNGQFAALAPLLLAPRDPTIGGFETADTYTVVVQHPITQGLPNSFVTPAMGSNIVISYAGVALMTGTTSGYPVITSGYGAGRVVQYASAGNYGGYNPFVDPNMNLLLQNTADWLTQ